MRNMYQVELFQPDLLKDLVGGYTPFLQFPRDDFTMFPIPDQNPDRLCALPAPETPSV